MKRREDTLSPESTHSHVSQDTPWPSTPGHAATAPHVGTSTSPHAGPVLQGRMSPWPLGSIPPGPTLAPGSIKMMEVQVTHPGNTGHAGLRRQQLPQASCPFLSGLGVKLGFPDPRHPHPTHLKPSWTQHGHPCPTVASCSSCLPWRLHSECRWSLSPAGGDHLISPAPPDPCGQNVHTHMDPGRAWGHLPLPPWASSVGSLCQAATRLSPGSRPGRTCQTESGPEEARPLE